jgi:hypothetical protein
MMIKLKRMTWAGRVARMGAMTNAYEILVGKREGKRPLGRPNRRRQVNIKVHLKETGLECVS